MRAARSAALFVLLTTACGKSHTGPEPDLETLTETGTFPPASAAAGSSLTVSFLVRHGPAGAVTTPRSGKPVTFTVVSGGGNVAGVTSTVVATGSDGIASVTWQLGAAAGSDVLRASINGTQSADVTVTATITPVAHLTVLTPPSASPQSGIPFFQQPAVQLSDPGGAPVAQAGVPVTVSVAGGGGTLGVAALAPGAGRANVASLVVNTDASGQAKFADLLLTGGGTVALQFAAPGYAPVSTAGLSLNSSPLIFTLTNGNESGPFGSTAGSQTYAGFTAPAGSTEFRVGLYNGTGTVHLYARRGSYPTATAFDCASLLTGTSQLCSAGANVAGQWYLAADGITPFQNVLVRAVAYGASCDRQPLGIGATANGTLNAASDCGVPSGLGPRDRFSLTALTQQTVTFNVTSSNTVGVDLKSPNSSRTRFGFSAAGGVTPPILLAPGDHDLEVTDGSTALNGGQTYALTVTPASADLASCGPVLMYETGVVATLTLATTDCNEIVPGLHADRFYTWALTGQTIVATMSSTAFDPLLRVLSGKSLGLAPVLATDDNGGGGTTAQVMYTNLGPPADFTVVAGTTLAGGLGAYTLTFQLSPFIYNAPALRAPAQHFP